MMKRFNLNFDWFFINNYQDNYIVDFHDNTNFERVDIPHSNVILPFNYLKEPVFNFISTYKKEIILDKKYQDKIIRLLFEGVAHKSDIFLNGNLIHTHYGGYDEFYVDIQQYLNFGETNYLTVLVDSSENENIPPFGNVVDYLGYGGIYREVFIDIYEKAHIEECFLSSIENKALKCNFRTTTNIGKLEIELIEKDSTILKKVFLINDYQQEIINEIDNLKLWDIDNPFLYTVIIRLYVNDILCDQYQTYFGFRIIKFSKTGFYLNNKHLKLRGLNRHQSYPYVGYAMPKSAQEKDADILKFDLGVNIVRTSHYMVSKHFLNRCDEIGLLVFEEIPGWQHIGDEEFKENSYKNVKSMITRDFNHPSIIIWGVRINESNDDETFYKTTNSIAKKIDPTRPTGGVRNFKNSQMFEDVYTFNDFTNSGGKKILQKPWKVKKGVPYLVSEYNGHMFPTKAYDDEAHRVEHALRHYQVLNEATKYVEISGTIGWCMNDYNTHQQFGSGDKICYHGVLDMYRNFKYAGYIYASQQSKTPVLEVLSTLNYGDYQAHYMKEIYIATNCDYVKLYKNNQLIDCLYSKKGNLPHPIIKVNDLIGNLLEINEGFSKRDAKITKKLFIEINKYGYNLPFKSKIQMIYILLKYKIKIKEASSLYFKYATGINSYRFEGYKNDEIVKSLVKENVYDVKYSFDLDKDYLEIGDTYDVVRGVVKKLDQNNNVLPYANDPLRVFVNGGIDIIGPKILSLHGGAISFWLKTNNQNDSGVVKVEVDDVTLCKTIKIKRGNL